MGDEQHTSVVDNNKTIISNWNSNVNKSDKVYVLGGFGIADLYHIVAELNGEIHFLNNYFVGDEKDFMDDLKSAIKKSNDAFLNERVVFEDCQIMTLNDEDCILSYLPLSDWRGKDTGTYCFHGLNDDIDIFDHNISCMSGKWLQTPVNIQYVKQNIETFKEHL